MGYKYLGINNLTIEGYITYIQIRKIKPKVHKERRKFKYLFLLIAYHKKYRLRCYKYGIYGDLFILASRLKIGDFVRISGKLANDICIVETIQKIR